MDNSWAKPGVKCVCIGDKGYKRVAGAIGVLVFDLPPTSLPRDLPVFMQQYTVDRVHPFMPFMSLVEITEAGVNMGFPIKDFRPLEEIEKDEEDHIHKSVDRKELV